MLKFIFFILCSLFTLSTFACDYMAMAGSVVEYKLVMDKLSDDPKFARHWIHRMNVGKSHTYSVLLKSHGKCKSLEVKTSLDAFCKGSATILNEKELSVKDCQ